MRAHQAITAEAVIDSSRMWPRGQAVKTAASHAVNVGSIPAGVTKRKEDLTKRKWCYIMPFAVGVDYREGPPVPIPNTEVKLVCADDSAWVTGCENR